MTSICLPRPTLSVIERTIYGFFPSPSNHSTPYVSLSLSLTCPGLPSLFTCLLTCSSWGNLEYVSQQVAYSELDPTYPIKQFLSPTSGNPRQPQVMRRLPKSHATYNLEAVRAVGSPSEQKSISPHKNRTAHKCKLICLLGYSLLCCLYYFEGHINRMAV